MKTENEFLAPEAYVAPVATVYNVQVRTNLLQDSPGNGYGDNNNNGLGY